jgi:iron complex transport system substrate-binding protein
LVVSKRNKLIAIILVIAIVMSGVIIVTYEDDDSDIFISNISDAIGRNVTIDSVPQRIVSCSPDITECIYSVGADPLLVGVTSFCDWPSAVVDGKQNGTLSVIGGYSDPNVESILALSPDLVLISSGVQTQIDMISQLDDLHIPVIALYKGDDMNEVYLNLDLIGKVTDTEDAAGSVVNQIKTTNEWISSIVSGSVTKSTIIQVVWLDPICVAGGSTYTQDMIETVNGENPYSDLDGWPFVTLESVLESNPDVVILTSTMMMESPQELLTYIRNDPIWAETNAVRYNQVYILTGQAENLFNRPGPRLGQAVELMADMLYPDLMNVTLPNVLGDDYSQYIQTSSNTTIPIAVVDASGTSVHLNSTPSRIVSLAPSITEMVYGIGLGDNLVGVTDYCDWPSDVVDRRTNGDLSIIGGYSEPNQEAIIDTDPDLVIVDSGVSAQMDIVPTLRTMGIDVLVLYKGTNIDEIMDNYEMLGDVAGRGHQADQVVASMEISLGWISSKLISETDTKSVMYSVWIDPFYVAGNDTFVQEMFVQAGLDNSFDDLSGWPAISMEAVLEADPDIIIIPSISGMTPEQTISYIRNNTIWAQLQAVQENGVYIVDGQALNLFSRPTERVVQGTELLAKMAYPNAFNLTVGNVIGDEYDSYLEQNEGSIEAPVDDYIPKAVYDAQNRLVTLSAAADRIVSCEPSTTEIVYALGMGSKLVAVSKNCDWPAEVTERKASGELLSIGSYNKPNLEAIVNATPDLVVLDASVKGQIALLPQLESLGIEVLVLYKNENIGQIFNNIEMIGNLNGRSVTAHEIISEMATDLMGIGDRLSGVTTSTTAIMAVSIDPTYVAGSKTFGNNMITVVGGENPFSSLNGWAVVSTESILQANPEVIVLTATMTGLNASATLAQLKLDPVWSQIDAVKNDRIYLLEGQANAIFSRPSVRLTDSVALLAMMLNPQMFDTALPNIVGDNYTTYIDW